MSDQPTPNPAKLLDAVVAVGAETDLRAALRRIVTVAVELVDARYGALGVLGRDGRPHELIYVGMDQVTVDAIGRPPSFCGVLRLVVDEPIRLADVAEHPHAAGFPSRHPRMRGFLGVPVRIRDSVFGNLYLTDKRSGEFTAEDERVAHALASMAGIAVENARLYQRSRRRERLLHAASDVARLLLAGAEDGEVFARIAEHVRDLTAATDAGVLLPMADGTIRLVAAAGESMTRAIGLELDRDKSLTAQVFRDGVALNLTNEDVVAWQRDRPGLPVLGPTLGVPLSAARHTRGVLSASRRRGDPSFTADELETLRGFAEQAELACELAERRRDSEALSLFADRDRIARNLHDLVIQRLFSTGMALEGAATVMAVDPDDARRRVQRAVADLDTTIKEIRTTVFALQQPADRTWSLRAKILEVVDAAVLTLGHAPSLRFDGPVDTVVDEQVGEQALAVLREALSNVARHARATAVAVLVTARRELTLEVVDDGVGMASASGRRSGLANMAVRAERLGGSMSVEDAAPGTRLRWSVPLPD